jgi:hypothetical protein
MNQPTLKLSGSSLEIAKQIHELKKKGDQDYLELMIHIHEYGNDLLEKLNEKNMPQIVNLFDELARELALPEDVMKKYVIDATYLDSHDIVFLKYLEDPTFVYDPDRGGEDLKFEADNPTIGDEAE